MPTVKDIAAVIEEFAPIQLQESYDNSGLQIGNPGMKVSAALLCLDVTEATLAEAKARRCNMIISHHPLLFKGIKQLIGCTPQQRIVMNSLRDNIAIYSAHTNLDSTLGGVSYEIARELGICSLKPLEPTISDALSGLGVIGDVPTIPALEFLRKIKDTFSVKQLRYSNQSSKLVIRKAAVCGGSGASLIPTAIESGADIIITGDVKYHDFTEYAQEIIIVDMGHYESELCTKKIFSRIIREKFPNFVTYFSESEKNPIQYI